MAKIQLQKSDSLILCQDFISSQFDDVIVTGIEFINSDNLKSKISRIEIDYVKEHKGK
ncbi:hypothetical protein [Neobacillus niacini]|uniref:hypothetical protein n=1 Tax=Neobacillus niacini TaxID=86668 RepID=UPI0021CAF06C|nr:hypothetical protein [Neobacillus niacini]MCM3764609.1 hypothetical protein [Neobacillus niacini]